MRGMVSFTGRLKWLWVLSALLLISVAAASTDFMEQRRKFRSEIKDKIEKELDDEGMYLSVTFKDERDKYDFKVSEKHRLRLKSYLKSYFNCEEESLLEKMVDELDRGRYIIYKEYHEEGVNIKVLFLSPEAKYWKWLIDGNGIERMFHTYNFSVGLFQTGNKQYVVLQTEGSFWGITQSVTLPMVFTDYPDERRFAFQMPKEDEIQEAVRRMEPIKPGRTGPLEKFIDACRQHPYFQQVDEDGEYAVGEDEIRDYYEMVVAELDEECPVKESKGHWCIQEDYPYLVVDYSLKTRVNIEAFIPRALRIGFITGTLEGIAQKISDEVSVKYVPLSMKNFRDMTQEWTRTGGPDK